MAWSDYADFSSVDKLRLTTPFDGILPLIKAVNERCLAAGRSLLSDDIRLYAIEPLSTVQNKITQLIEDFVNHTDNGGNWHGQADSNIPMWTEADILTYIGATERIVLPDRLDELSVEWLYQQYEILNLLLWTETNTNVVVEYSGYDGQTDGWEYYSVEDAVDAAIANKLETSSGLIRNQTASSVRNYMVTGERKYYGGATSGEGKFNFPSIDGGSLNSAADIYFYAVSAYFGDPSFFDGAGIAIEGLNLFESLIAQKFPSYTTSKLGNREIFPVYPEPGTVSFNSSAIGWMADRAYFVSKFNVPGGFEFI